MGRYLERASHQCRLLQLQTEALVDRPVSEIYSGWRRIYNSLDREPPGASLEMAPAGAGESLQVQWEVKASGQSQMQQVSDEFTMADSFTLADDLTFERTNNGSMWSCFASGRENARQMRHCISSEMWRSLNLSYLKLQQISILDIWMASPENFYAETAEDIEKFMGVAAATMYRDEGWHFMQLGRFLERSQLASNLLLAQLDLGEEPTEDTESDWTTLLRFYHAQEAYNRKYNVEIAADQVLDLLITDPLLPDSMRRAVDTMAEELAAVGSGPNRETSAAANRLAGRLGSLVLYEWPDTEDKRQLLGRIAELSRQLHRHVSGVYFDY